MAGRAPRARSFTSRRPVRTDPNHGNLPESSNDRGACSRLQARATRLSRLARILSAPREFGCPCSASLPGELEINVEKTTCALDALLSNRDCREGRAGDTRSRGMRRSKMSNTSSPGPSRCPTTLDHAGALRVEHDAHPPAPSRARGVAPGPLFVHLSVGEP